jgi:alanyl-tRNA synthetase
MRQVTGSEIRRRFLDYFAARGHAIVPSAPLVPRADPTLLFTNAGMVQFKDVFLGTDVRPYRRATTAQKCVRAGGKHNDLENVGRTARHHTFFEMLGNFSFGDYFKAEAIAYAWEFVTETLGLPAEGLWATVYQDDEEAFGLWQRIADLPASRVVRLGKQDNFWSMGETGPCGPCSELVIDQGPAFGCGRPTCAVGCECDRYLELWNLVFMQFDCAPDGRLTPLPKPSIDTGAGLERLAAVLQGVGSNFETDLLRPLIAEVEVLSGRRYGAGAGADVSLRVIADHARAAAFLITDGVLPSNEGRGYVLRRILRRAMRHGRLVGLDGPFLGQVAARVADLMGAAYPELEAARAHVTQMLLYEQERFGHTLRVGQGLVEDALARAKAAGASHLPGAEIFRLYDTYGFPVDLLQEIAAEQGLALDEAGFEREMAGQRERARAAWAGSGEAEAPAAYQALRAAAAVEFLGHATLEAEGRVVALRRDGAPCRALEEGEEGEVILDRTPFYGEAGGQVGDQGLLLSGQATLEVLDTQAPLGGLIVHRARVRRGGLAVGEAVQARVDARRRAATAANHTATHLLHAALRQVLGDHVKQAGSLVAPDRLRFDFTHLRPIDDRALELIEDLVNEKALANLAVETEWTSLDAALRSGATALFGEKYGERVRVVRVPGFSQELCGGTHVRATGEVGLFRIVGESGVASGVRRIEAVTGRGALRHLRAREATLVEAAAALKVKPPDLPERAERLAAALKEQERELERLRARLAGGAVADLLARAQAVEETPVVAGRVERLDAKGLREVGDRVRSALRRGVIVLGSAGDGRVAWLAMVTPDLTPRLHAGRIVKAVAQITGGSGGGRPDLAEAGGREPGKLDEALAAVPGIIRAELGRGGAAQRRQPG